MNTRRKYKKIICIITHKGNLDKVAAIKATWLSKPLFSDYLVLFVYGNDGGVVPRVEGDKLFVEAKESWENLPNKIYDLLSYCIDHFEFEYLFKIDDDVYLDTNHLIKHPIHAVDYAGFVHDYRGVEAEVICRSRNYAINNRHAKDQYEGRIPDYKMFGPCYLLSYNFVHWFSQNPREHYEDCCMKMGYEDMMLGKAYFEYKLGMGIEESIELWGGHIEFWRENFPDCIKAVNPYSSDLSAKKIRTHHRMRFIRSIKNMLRPIKQYLRGEPII